MRLNPSARFPNISAVTSPRLVKSPFPTSDTNTRNCTSCFCILSRSSSVETRAVIRSNMTLNALAICPTSSSLSSFARACKFPAAACVATSATWMMSLTMLRARKYPMATARRSATTAPPSMTLVRCTAMLWPLSFNSLARSRMSCATHWKRHIDLPCHNATSVDSTVIPSSLIDCLCSSVSEGSKLSFNAPTALSADAKYSLNVKRRTSSSCPSRRPSTVSCMADGR